MKSREEETRPWIARQSPQEIEAWIDQLNHELQQIGRDRPSLASERGASAGVCLMLAHGGEICVSTNPDGDVLLDVSSDASWISPLIVAATDVQPPRGALWIIPGGRLIELMMGLNSLIEAERLVWRRNSRSGY